MLHRELGHHHSKAAPKMDAQYVKDVVEGAVVEGLTAAVRQQPEDAVDFLGRFLMHYADHMEHRTKARACHASCTAASSYLHSRSAAGQGCGGVLRRA